MKRTLTIAMLATAVALGLGIWPGVGGARTTTTVTWTEHGTYTCVGPCAVAPYFFAPGTAHSKELGTMREDEVGTVLRYDAAKKCSYQDEHWAFTSPNDKDSIFITTTSDSYCFTANPNVAIEKATFKITGGVGRFKKATGSGTAQFRVLGHPQTGSGTITMNITY